MATIISRRQLQPGEFAEWERRFAAASEARAAAGCRGVRRFVSRDDPHDVTVIFDWSSHAAAREFIESNIRRLQQMNPQALPPVIDTWYVDELAPLAG